MIKNRYDNEEVIYAYGKATTSLFDDNRGALVYYAHELEQLNSRNKNLKILDVGCGAGNKTKVLKTLFPNWDFGGCDISHNAIKMARANPEKVKFFVANAEKLPLASNKFDVVIMHSVLDHTRYPDKAAKEAFRILKKGGVFLLMDPLEEEPNTIHGQLTRFKSFRQHRKNRLGHNHAFSKRFMIELLENSGFKVRKMTFEWFYFAQIVDILYYPLLSLAGKGPEYTIKKYVSTNKSISAKLLIVLKKFVSFLINTESYLARGLPLGFFAYVKAKKI